MLRIFLALVLGLVLYALLSVVLYFTYRRTLLFKLWVGMGPGLIILMWSGYISGWMGEVSVLYKLGVMVMGSGAFFIGLLFVSRRLTSRLLELIATVGKGSVSIKNVVEMMVGSSQSLASGVSEQAATLEEVSATLEELSTMTSQNADSASRAESLAREASDTAAEGTTGVQHLTRAMGDIKASAEQTTRIIKTIDEIAFKTNILSLNAAVEAARAGEAGRGFAVVADEVRSLAKHSAEAAKSTSELISGTRSAIEGGVHIAEGIEGSLGRMAAVSDEVKSIVAEVAEVSRQQAQGIHQVNDAVVQMNSVTQSTAASAEENSATGEELDGEVASLEEVVIELERIAGVRA